MYFDNLKLFTLKKLDNVKYSKTDFLHIVKIGRSRARGRLKTCVTFRLKYVINCYLYLELTMLIKVMHQKPIDHKIPTNRYQN